MFRATVESVNGHTFHLAFRDDTCCVQVQRGMDRLKELDESLLNSFSVLYESTPMISLGEEPTPDDLERYLNFWLGLYGESVTIFDDFNRFMEEPTSHSEIAQLQHNFLRWKISDSAQQKRRNETEFSVLRSKCAQLEEMIAFLQRNLRASSGSAEDDTLGLPSRSGSYSDNNNNGGRTTLSAMSSINPSPDGSELSLLARTPLGAENGNGKGPALHLLSPPLPPLMSPPSGTAELLIADATPVDDESPRGPYFASGGGGSGGLSAGEDAMQNAEALRALCPDAHQARFFDEGVQEVLRWLQPHPSQVAFRASVSALVKRQVRYTLRVSVLDSGLHELRCFLPDDATKLTVALGKLRAAQWQKTVHDRLTVLSTQPELSRAAAMRVMDDEYVTDQDDEFPVYDHVVSKVQVTNEDATFKVDCLVDSTEVSISCNRRVDVCMLAFFEEVASLVGRDDLFKRSLQLIRAWWFYETALYVGTPIRQYLSEGTTCTMVCAIFNQHHARIHSPLQALCLFLAEYSAYDGATQAITLQGIVPFRGGGPNGNQIVIPDVQDHHLLSSVVLEKYWALFNIQDVAPPPHFGQPSLVDELNEDLCHGTFLVRGHRVPGSPYYMNYAAGSPVNSAQRAYALPTSRLDRHVFNVAHPFVCANKVERLSPKRAQRIQKAFVQGAAQFLTLLRRVSQEQLSTSVAQLIKGFFPVVQSRFGQGFVRPDRIPEQSPQFRNASALTDTALMVVKTDRLMLNILYCNMVLESVLSDAALLVLCTEILKEKKIQPVGEVGKMLAEITSTASMSNGLKEKFGGLKKFLEHYNMRFIFATDHPFNPCVTLRGVLEGLRLEVSDAGVQALGQMQKAKKSGSKRPTPVSTPDMSQLSRDSGQFTSSSGTSSARSPLGAHMAISPLIPSAMMISSNNGVVGRESYSYGGSFIGSVGVGGGASHGADNRRKIASHGSNMMLSDSQSVRAPEFDPYRRGPGAPAPSPGYSPRLSVHQAHARVFTATPHLPPQQQQQQQLHAQQHSGQAMHDGQRGGGGGGGAGSRSQYVPMPIPGSANNAYPRAFNRQYQQPVGQPGMGQQQQQMGHVQQGQGQLGHGQQSQGQLGQGQGGQHSYHAGMMGTVDARTQYANNVYPAPVQTAPPAPPPPQPIFGMRASLPLYARSGLPPTSPQLTAHRDPEILAQLSLAQAHTATQQAQTRRYSSDGTEAALLPDGISARRPVSLDLDIGSQQRSIDDLLGDIGTSFHSNGSGLREPSNGFGGIVDSADQGSGVNGGGASRLTSTYPGANTHVSGGGSSGGSRSSSNMSNNGPHWY